MQTEGERETWSGLAGIKHSGCPRFRQSEKTSEMRNTVSEEMKKKTHFDSFFRVGGIKIYRTTELFTQKHFAVNINNENLQTHAGKTV